MQGKWRYSSLLKNNIIVICAYDLQYTVLAAFTLECDVNCKLHRTLLVYESSLCFSIFIAIVVCNLLLRLFAIFSCVSFVFFVTSTAYPFHLTFKSSQARLSFLFAILFDTKDSFKSDKFICKVRVHIELIKVTKVIETFSSICKYSCCKL